MGDCTRPSRERIDESRPPPRRLHPRSVLRRPKLWVPRSCQAAVESLERGDRIRRTASSTSTKVTKPNYRTQSTPRCHISFTRQRNTAIYLEIAVTFTTSAPATILCEGGHHGPREVRPARWDSPRCSYPLRPREPDPGRTHLTGWMSADPLRSAR